MISMTKHGLLSGIGDTSMPAAVRHFHHTHQTRLANSLPNRGYVQTVWQTITLIGYELKVIGYQLKVIGKQCVFGKQF